MPLDEGEYTNFEEHSFKSGDGFTDGFNDGLIYDGVPIDATSIMTFSFEPVNENKTHSTDIKIESAPGDISQNEDISKDIKFSQDNKTITQEPPNLSASPATKIRGLTPKINNEAFDIKRCYQFRASTLKKLNQLKGESDNINIYLNEIIDAAICFYHDSVFNKNKL
jgi:hypothetical protein